MNQEILFLNNKKIPTEQFGDLFIKVTLLFYDYPRCFIAMNSDKKVFALTENDDSENNFGWNLTIISLNDVNDVNKGIKSIQSLFSNKESFLLKYFAEKNVCTATKVESFVNEYAVLGETFCKDFCDMDEVFDYHQLQATANLEEECSISFVYEGGKGTKTSNFLKALNCMKTMLKNINSPLKIDNSILSVQHGSTVISFSFENDSKGTLFEGQDNADSSSKGVVELGNLLSANNAEQILSETNCNNKALSSYSKLVNALENESERRPKLILTVPKRENASCFDFRKTAVSEKKQAIFEAKKKCDEATTYSDENIEIDGVLTGILTGSKNKFSFRANNGIIYEGTVDFSLVGNDAQFSVNGVIYSSVINKTLIRYKNGTEKPIYKLLKLTKKEDIKKYKNERLF
ncbi:MAG: hypothetical protein K6E21_04005 [Bacilli bacterium]|nr:hypothetical protein [Bacilli bacterium]